MNAHRIQTSAAETAETATTKLAMDLSGVPETALWTLWNRAGDAAGPRPLLRDPLAVELVKRIDYDFRGRFGRPKIVHSIRARFADELIRAFLLRHPGGVVVCLGEGLETQLWRVDDGMVRWFSVDLPQAIAARRRLLPRHERNTPVEGSALALEWLDVVPHDAPIFVSAAGLFMYFERDQVIGLLRAMVQRLRSGELFFDTIPPWFSRQTLRGWKLTRNYTAPPMPFALPLGAVAEFVAEVPGLHLVDALTYAEPYPDRVPLFALLSLSRTLKNTVAPGLIHARV